MTLVETLYAQAMRAFREPRGAAADLISLGIPREALVPGLFLVVAISVILNTVSEILAPNPFIEVQPFQMAMMLMLVLLVFSFATAKTGQMIGGLGSFQDALLLMVFLQALFIPAVVLQILIFLVSPGLAGAFIVAVMIFLTWMHINFIAALHSFPNLGRAFAVLLMAMLVTFFALMLIVPFFVTTTGALGDV